MDEPPHAHAVVIAHRKLAPRMVKTVKAMHLQDLCIFASQFVHLPTQTEVEVFGSCLSLSSLPISANRKGAESLRVGITMYIAAMKSVTVPVASRCQIGIVRLQHINTCLAQ